jgi:hypothetical protein
MPHGEYSAFLKQPLVVEEHVLSGAREPLGDRSPYESRIYSEFADILQVEIRQQVSGVRMLIHIFGEGSMRPFWSRDPWQNRHPEKHRMLPDARNRGHGPPGRAHGPGKGEFDPYHAKTVVCHEYVGAA